MLLQTVFENSYRVPQKFEVDKFFIVYKERKEKMKAVRGRRGARARHVEQRGAADGLIGRQREPVAGQINGDGGARSLTERKAGEEEEGGRDDFVIFQNFKGQTVKQKFPVDLGLK